VYGDLWIGDRGMWIVGGEGGNTNLSQFTVQTPQKN
jgi:hypothetical protein